QSNQTAEGRDLVIGSTNNLSSQDSNGRNNSTRLPPIPQTLVKEVCNTMTSSACTRAVFEGGGYVATYQRLGTNSTVTFTPRVEGDGGGRSDEVVVRDESTDRGKREAESALTIKSVQTHRHGVWLELSEDTSKEAPSSDATSTPTFVAGPSRSTIPLPAISDSAPESSSPSEPAVNTPNEAVPPVIPRSAPAPLARDDSLMSIC
ncbi:hypothetical protein C8Q75DRAFT_735212, partial [Abortiporus biennis]